MKPIKELDFHSKVLNDFYNEYPIQLHVGEFYFEYDDEDDEYETLDTVMVVFFVCIIKGNPIGIIQL